MIEKRTRKPIPTVSIDEIVRAATKLGYGPPPGINQHAYLREVKSKAKKALARTVAVEQKQVALMKSALKNKVGLSEQMFIHLGNTRRSINVYRVQLGMAIKTDWDPIYPKGDN